MCYLCAAGWSTGINFTQSDVYGLREIIVVAAYIIGGTVGLVLIIAIILTLIQRAVMLRQARARACRDSGSRRQLVRDSDSGRGARSATADLPPAYDTVMSTPEHGAARTTDTDASAGNNAAASSSQLLTTDDVVRPPSYDDVLQQNVVAK